MRYFFLKIPFTAIWLGFSLVSNLIADGIPFAMGFVLGKNIRRKSYRITAAVSFLLAVILTVLYQYGRYVHAFDWIGFIGGVSVSYFFFGLLAGKCFAKKDKERKTVNVVAAVIRNGDRIFATQRGYGEFKDYWEFPGGKTEEGETPEEALRREIKEELDTDISVGEHIQTIDYDYPDFHLHMDCFFADIVSGDLILREHEAAKWLGKDELDSVEWLPADRTLIEEIRKRIS